jgi:hypothetical protein
MALSACQGIPVRMAQLCRKHFHPKGVGQRNCLRKGSYETQSQLTQKGQIMRTLALLACLTLPATPALADITVTTDRGGSGTISRDCDRGEGQASCTVEGTFTGAEGKTALKTRIRTAERGQFTTEVSVTGPEGNTRTRERSWSRD